MGGEAFKGPDGEPLTTGIRKSEVGPTLDALLREVLQPIGIKSFVPLGSTGKKEMSGDLDIAIGPVPTSDPKALKALKDAILQGIQASVGQDKAKLVGQNIGIMYPIVGSPDRFVQVDLMLSGAPENTGWLMSGTGSGVKGVYRNLLLAYVAKIRSEENPGTKITISFPGGVQSIKDGQTIVPRTEDPATIVATLGIPAEPSEINTFEELVTILARDPELSGKLAGYETYIARYIQDPHTSIEAMKAVAALKSATGLMEAVRRFVRKL
jgi:hypothetical protein